jgi:transcriptional regulator with XRE-family HTH domain
MAQSKLLLEAIRARLRARGMTYRELAGQLGVSEPTVKRDLSRGDFPLSRLDRICEVLGVSFAELCSGEHDGPPVLTRLSAEQEAALVSDPKLLLAAYLVVNDWKFAEIIATYRFDENDLVKLLLRLDQLRIVDYRPPYRVQKLTARNFAWRKDGPVQEFFLRRVVPEFLGGRFEGAGDAVHFIAGLLSEASRRHVAASLERLVQEFEELARRDARLPLEARDGCSAVLALRQWEFSEFTALRR